MAEKRKKHPSGGCFFHFCRSTDKRRGSLRFLCPGKEKDNTKSKYKTTKFSKMLAWVPKSSYFCNRFREKGNILYLTTTTRQQKEREKACNKQN
jgi:hypothetical protein